MWEHRHENYPALAHAMVAADPERVRRFAQLWTALADSHAGGEENRALAEQLHAWSWEDHGKERADRVAWLDAQTEAGMRQAVEQAKLLPAEQRVVVEDVLTTALASPAPIPRTAAFSLRCNLGAQERLLALDDVPMVILTTQAHLVARALTSWRCLPDRDWHLLRPDRAYEYALFRGLTLCTLVSEEGRRGANLGLGLSHVVRRILGLEDEDLDRIDRGLVQQRCDHEESFDALELIDPAVGRAPLVPTARLHARGPSYARVADHLEECGPIGWAVGGDVRRLAEQYESLAASHEEGAQELRGVAQRLHATADAGQAVLAALELASYEGDGRINVLIDDRDALLSNH